MLGFPGLKWLEWAEMRTLVIWCPDWPVLAAMAAQELPRTTPVAVVADNQVLACSAVARAEGIRRGMRRRDASATCPELVLVAHDPERDVRSFEEVLAGIEQLTAQVSPIRPGLCALILPSRFYGDEPEAVATLAEALVQLGVWDCRLGLADGLFAAEQAARLAAPQDCVIVPPGGSAEFLTDLPISALDRPELVSVLRRLGLRRLGDFARLSARDVLTRFGRDGAWLHRLASGVDGRSAARRRPPLEVDQCVEFEPPLETIEPIVFSSRRTAERCVAVLAEHGLVCTEVTVEVSAGWVADADDQWVGRRTWTASRWFAAADLVDRLYWQLQADPASGPVHRVRFLPERVESLSDHGEGLWGSATDERIERGVARLQGMLGPEAVLAPSLIGGRQTVDRQALTPWGAAADRSRPAGLPWPGSIPPPAPTRVFRQPVPAVVLGRDSRPVAVSDRGMLNGELVTLRSGSNNGGVTIEAWAGPWPIDELWWAESGSRQVARFQVVGSDGSAWLLLLEDGQWWCEARYD